MRLEKYLATFLISVTDKKHAQEDGVAWLTVLRATVSLKRESTVAGTGDN